MSPFFNLSESLPSWWEGERGELVGRRSKCVRGRGGGVGDVWEERREGAESEEVRKRGRR